MDGEDTGSPGSRFSTLIESDYDYARPRRGQVCQAVVLSVGENDVIVDLGAKRDGFVPRRDLELLDEAYRTGLQIGDRVPVCVLDARGPHGGVVVSLNRGLAQQDWLRAQECLESGEICQAKVEEVNRGGVITGEGDQIFFHQRQILGGNGAGAREGQGVLFHVRDTAKGPEALNVELREE